ncbi:hypothetical protein F5051DRAFT_446066, partial [Lentinula edodes]
PRLFTTVDEKPLPTNGAILKWFGELDDVVRSLYYLISTTWGGGSRGTEIEHLLYANHLRNLRNIFVINGLLTIVTEYQKTQSVAGAGKLMAYTPAFQVNRLMILVLGVAYWAAGYLGCFIGMDKLNCQRYFYEVFVLTGVSMESKDFSKVLGSMNSLNLGIGLKLSDFHQLTACMLISSTSTSFFDPNNEDPNVVAAHELFGHSLDMGRINYGLDSMSEATGLAADAVAHMQQVSIKCQVFLKLVHPVLEQQVHQDGGIRSANAVPSYHNPRRASVHPAARQALKAVLRRKYNPSTRFTSAKQAELVNSVPGSSLHVFGIIKTGGGKSLAFFGAPFLFPKKLFVVVSPVVALTQDLRRRLLETCINGGIWNEEPIDIHAAQLVLVSAAHKAGTDEFHNWITSEGVLLSLKDLTLVDEIRRYSGGPNLEYMVEKVVVGAQYELKKVVSGPAIFQFPLSQRLNAAGKLPSSGSAHHPGDDLDPPLAKKRKIGTLVSSSPSLGASSTFTAGPGGGVVTPPASSLNVDDPRGRRRYRRTTTALFLPPRRQFSLTPMIA